MTQDDGRAIWDEALELPVSDFGIEQAHAGGMNVHEDIVLSQLRFRHFPRPYAIGVAIPVEDECLHRW